MYGEWMKKINTDITVDDIYKYNKYQKIRRKRMRENKINKIKEDILGIKQKIAIVR